MRIEVRRRGEVFVVKLEGEMRGEPEPDVVREVTALFAGPGTRVVIDLSEVSFLSSTGIGELVRIAAQANTEECRVVMASPTPLVSGLFDATQLDRFFEIAPTVEEGLRRVE